MSGPAYDTVELRRRMAVCFSVGELRALAEALGVSNVRWDRGTDEGSREIIRQCERYSGLGPLVAKLRELRPLVEWPEEPSLPAAGFEVMPVPATLASEGGGPPELLSSPGTFGPPIAGAAPPSIAAPPPPVTSVAPPPSNAIPVPTSAAPAAPAFVPRPWTPPVPSEATAPRGVDPRILVAVAGLMLAAAIVAYLAGRASSSPSSAPVASASPDASALRRDGPAGRASLSVARAYASLARVCELPPSAANDLVFRRVFERCGPVATPRLVDPGPSLPTAPADPPESSRDPRDRGRPTRGARDPAAPPPPGRGCVGQCDATHASCRSRCGPEPTDTGAYAGWQKCQSQCLIDASRCRLTCH